MRKFLLICIAFFSCILLFILAKPVTTFGESTGCATKQTTCVSDYAYVDGIGYTCQQGRICSCPAHTHSDNQNECEGFTTEEICGGNQCGPGLYPGSCCISDPTCSSKGYECRYDPYNGGSTSYYQHQGSYDWSCNSSDSCFSQKSCDDVNGRCARGAAPAGYTWDPNAPNFLDDDCGGGLWRCFQPYSNFPSCTIGKTSCGAFDNGTMAFNDCGFTNRNQTCTHDENQPCNPHTYTNTENQFLSRCNANVGYSCFNQNTCEATITVHVYIDYGHDGSHDANYPFGIVSINGGNATTTGNDGTVTYDRGVGTYIITYNDNSADYQQIGPTQQTVTLDNTHGDQTVAFRVTPLYRISGNVFSDINKDLNQDNAESAYTGTSTIHISGGPTAHADMTQTDGTYDTGEVLQSGTYTVKQTHALNAGYFYTTPSTWTVIVGNRGTAGPQCNKSTSPDAACGNPNDGSISNLNFGVTNEIPWQQSACFDVRDDSGTYADQIPAAPSCGGVSGAYNTITNGSCSTGAGIVFSCDATPDFGQGAANANDWQAGGPGNQQECFTNQGLDVIRTSYSYLLTTARQSNITPTNMATICGAGGIANCTLSGSLTKGIYSAEGDVHLNAYTFPVDANAPQSFIFLIHGNLYLQGNIIVPAGSVAAFSSSGNIYVDKSVGQVVTNPDDASNNNPNIEGLYSADGSFIVSSYANGNNVCNADGSPLDKKLNVIGSIVTNAAKTGGTFTNNRDLCIYDLQCSPVSTGEGLPNGNGAGDENLATSYLLTLFADGGFLNHKLFNWEELRP